MIIGELGFEFMIEKVMIISILFFLLRGLEFSER